MVNPCSFIKGNNTRLRTINSDEKSSTPSITPLQLDTQEKLRPIMTSPDITGGQVCDHSSRTSSRVALYVNNSKSIETRLNPLSCLSLDRIRPDPSHNAQWM